MTRLWERARDGLVHRLRPVIARLGIAELVRLGETMEDFERALMSHARSTYDRADLDVIVTDPEVAKHYEEFGRAALIVMREYPHWLGKPRARNLFPGRALQDRAVRSRVSQGIRHMDPMTMALQALDTNVIGPERKLQLVTSEEERATNPCWWAYDSGVPVALAERLLAGRRAGIIPTLIRLSKRNWTDDSLRRAALDWADDVADFAGLFAAITGADLNIPADRRFDLVAVLEHHRQTRSDRDSHFERGLTSLRSN